MPKMSKAAAGTHVSEQPVDMSVVPFDAVVAEVARDGGVRFAPRLSGPPPRVDGHLLAMSYLEGPRRIAVSATPTAMS